MDYGQGGATEEGRPTLLLRRADCFVRAKWLRSVCARIGVMSHKPIFCLVLREGELWQVEAEWPDGTIELVDTFKAHFDALHWMRTQSAAWIEERISATQVDAS